MKILTGFLWGLISWGLIPLFFLAPEILLAQTSPLSQTTPSARPNLFALNSPMAAPLSDLDTAFARALKEQHAPGFAVAVVLKDKIIYARGFGYRDYEHRLPITPNTLFSIASCTKAFTASLIGMMPKNAKIALDSPIRHYLPDLKFYNDNMNDRITVRDMLCHRTGLPRHDASWYYFYTASRAELLSRIQYQAPTADVHEKWQYNNLMFVALGVLTEQINKETWEESVQKKIFDPLDMERSTSDFSTWTNDKDAALGYSVKNDSLIHREAYKDFKSANPCGGIASSVNDMAKWLLLWIHGGRTGDLQLIPSDFFNEAISPQMVMPGGLPTKEKPGLYLSNYGFAWILGSYRGHYRVTHDGLTQGFSSLTTFYPSDSLGIIVLCNQQSSNIPAVVRNLVADKMLGLPGYDWQTDLQKVADKQASLMRLGKKMARIGRVPNTSPSHPLHDFTGTFENKGYGRIRIETRNDSLYAVLPAVTIWLRHYHYDIFETIEMMPGEAIDTVQLGVPHLQFNTGDNGYISGLSVQLESSLPPAVFARIPDPPPAVKPRS
jgi:CubicO group peptidase (beta-lactamase class C family)